jgi:hypothetical protein
VTGGVAYRRSASVLCRIRHLALCREAVKDPDTHKRSTIGGGLATAKWSSLTTGFLLFRLTSRGRAARSHALRNARFSQGPAIGRNQVQLSPLWGVGNGPEPGGSSSCIDTSIPKINRTTKKRRKVEMPKRRKRRGEAGRSAAKPACLGQCPVSATLAGGAIPDRLSR